MKVWDQILVSRAGQNAPPARRFRATPTCAARDTEAAFFAYGRAVLKRRKYPRMRRGARRTKGTHHAEGGLAERGRGDGLADGTRGLFPGGGGGSAGFRLGQRVRWTDNRRRTWAERVGLRDRAGARARRTLATTRRGAFSRASRVTSRSLSSRDAAGRWPGVEATRRARGAAKHLSPDSKKCERPESRAEEARGERGGDTPWRSRADGRRRGWRSPRRPQRLRAWQPTSDSTLPCA